jgi:hypothetical protein
MSTQVNADIVIDRLATQVGQQARQIAILEAMLAEASQPHQHDDGTSVPTGDGS